VDNFGCLQILVAGQQTKTIPACVIRNHAVIRRTHANPAYVHGFVTARLNASRGGEWQIRVHEKPHLALGWEWVMLLLFNQLAGEAKRSANIFKADPVLPLHILECHPARQAANHHRHRQTCPAYHRLAVTNLWINYDAIVHTFVSSFKSWS
jgi:hypothetical protein